MAGNSGLPGVVLRCPPLYARIVDNGRRLLHVSDTVGAGMNGVATLKHDAQGKNVFSTVGMNLEGVTLDPPAGACYHLPQAPRRAPMTLVRLDDRSARLTQNAAEGAGLNFEITFTLGEGHVDQTIVSWPDHDVSSSQHFYASYMNQPLNTSLFLRGRMPGCGEEAWLEATSPGHGGDGAVYFRPVDPSAATWHEFNRDNPVLRQKMQRDAESIGAAEAVGFRRGEMPHGTPFFFGFVDDFVLLYIFREDVVKPWMSASGATAVRNPAWDYEIFDGPQRAGERRCYHVRLVYERFESLDNILAEADRFRNAGGP